MDFGLERRYFVGDFIDARETEQVFSTHWFCVGHLDHLFPNDDGDRFHTVKIGRFEILLVSSSAGIIRAFHNNCRHRGTRLVDSTCGPLSNSCLTCPYHAWTYNVEGELIGAPNMQDVAEFDVSDFSLRTVACVVWNRLVLIHLSGQGEGFDGQFQDIDELLRPWRIGELTTRATLTYQVQANWKLIFQNFSECYHCPTVHPRLNRLTPYRNAKNDLVDGPILGGPMALSDDCETVSTDGKRIGDLLPGLDVEQRRCVYYYTVFPNLFLSAHPDYVLVHELHRIDCRTTRVDCRFLVPSSTAPEQLERAVTQWDEVNRQDWQVCELTQRGIESPAYQPGPYSNLEPMLVAFDRYYRSVMQR